MFAHIEQVLKTLADHVRVMNMGITQVRKSEGLKDLLGKFECQGLSEPVRLWCSSAVQVDIQKWVRDCG
jgi:hypothetical protein